MFSIILIVAGFKAGCPLLSIFIVIMAWTIILCSNPFGKAHKKKNPIDEYGDKYYGTIDWLYKNKL